MKSDFILFSLTATVLFFFKSQGGDAAGCNSSLRSWCNKLKIIQASTALMIPYYLSCQFNFFY